MKNILIILLVVFSGLSFGQTKEETIAWLKEKIEKYNENVDQKNYKMEYINITPCKIEYKISYKHSENGIITVIDEYPTNAVSLKGYGLNFNSKVVKSILNVNGENHEYLTDFTRIYTDREDNLVERFLKAIQHLNTFCEKKKEVF